MLNNPPLNNPPLQYSEVIIPINEIDADEIDPASSRICKLFSGINSIKFIGFAVLSLFVVGCTFMYFNTNPSYHHEIDENVIETTSKSRSLSSSDVTREISDLLKKMYAYNVMNTGLEMKKQHLFWALLHDSDKYFENVDKFMPYYFIGNQSVRGGDFDKGFGDTLRYVGRVVGDYARYTSSVYKYLETRKQIAQNTWDQELDVIREDVFAQMNKLDIPIPENRINIPEITRSVHLMQKDGDNEEVQNFNKLINDKSYYQTLFQRLAKLQGEFIQKIGKILEESTPEMLEDDHQTPMMDKTVNGFYDLFGEAIPFADLKRNESLEWWNKWHISRMWSDKRFKKKLQFKEEYAQKLDDNLRSNEVYQELFALVKEIAESIHLYQGFNENLEKDWDPIQLQNKGLSWKGQIFQFKHTRQEIFILRDDARDYFWRNFNTSVVDGYGFITNDHSSIMKYKFGSAFRREQETLLRFDQVNTLYGGVTRPFAEEYSQVVRYVNQGLSSDYIEMIKCVKKLIHLAKLNDIGDYLSYIEPWSFTEKMNRGAGNLGDNVVMAGQADTHKAGAESNYLKNDWINLNDALSTLMYGLSSPAFVPAAMAFNEFVFQCKAIMFVSGVPLTDIVPVCAIFDYGIPLFLHFVGNWYEHGFFRAWKETKETAAKLYDPNFYKLMEQSEDLLLPNLFTDLKQENLDTKYTGMISENPDSERKYAFSRCNCKQLTVKDVNDDLKSAEGTDHRTPMMDSLVNGFYNAVGKGPADHKRVESLKWWNDYHVSRMWRGNVTASNFYIHLECGWFSANVGCGKIPIPKVLGHVLLNNMAQYSDNKPWKSLMVNYNEIPNKN